MLVPEQGQYGRCSFQSSPFHAFQDHEQLSCPPVSACWSNDPRPKLISANLTKVMQAFKLILLVLTFILWSYQYYRLDCKHEEIYPQKEEAMPNNRTKSFEFRSPDIRSLATLKHCRDLLFWFPFPLPVFLANAPTLPGSSFLAPVSPLTPFPIIY